MSDRRPSASHLGCGSVGDLFVERSKTQPVRPWSIGTLFARAGRSAEMVEYLEAAVREGDSNVPYLSVDPIFDPLRRRSP